jgi:DNA mismatch repair protein MutL
MPPETPERVIRLLPVSMVNKIAAGEVIERPASVVKELVENSLDAGANRIDIAIENGGASLIRIIDNGSGIASQQLELALSPHATSKIVDADDLFRISSFGFRGEALASIAEVSQMTLKSKTANSNEGAFVTGNGGERSEVKPLGIPQGTQIEVRNLFFNTPVRRKYMKAAATEFGHISETFVRLALPHPHIRFTLQHNGKMIHDLPADNTPLSRIRQLFGNEAAEHLIYVESRTGTPVSVKGYVSHPNISRNNNRLQYFFLNRRYIRDKALQHALMESYRGLLTVGRFPLAFLEIELKPDMFDVNVHPAKMEVRFLDQSRVYAGFLGTIREKFLSTDLNGRFTKEDLQQGQNQQYGSVNNNSVNSTNNNENKTVKYSAVKRTNDPADAMDSSAAQDSRRSVNDWVQNIIQNKAQNNSAMITSARAGDVSPPIKSPISSPTKPAVNSASSLSLHSLPERSQSDTPQTSDKNSTPFSGRAAYRSDEMPFASQVAYSPSGKTAVQMHDSYIILETDEGIAVIDQHALHERILYEKLKTGYEDKKLASQRLLVPVPADLSPNEYIAVVDNLDSFKQLGLTAEPFGGNTVLISAVPVILHKVPPLEILMSMLEPLLSSGKKLNPAELLEEMLHSIACKAAVKAGDKLSMDSMTELIRQAESEANSHHCPHGRPSMLVFTKEELDKKFKRT